MGSSCAIHRSYFDIGVCFVCISVYICVNELSWLSVYIVRCVLKDVSSSFVFQYYQLSAVQENAWFWRCYTNMIHKYLIVLGFTTVTSFMIRFTHWIDMYFIKMDIKFTLVVIFCIIYLSYSCIAFC